MNCPRASTPEVMVKTFNTLLVLDHEPVAEKFGGPPVIVFAIPEVD
jgi:hypothetical protein